AAVLRRTLRQPRATWGMTLAHAGMAVTIAGITGSTAWTEELIVSGKPGATYDIAGYTIALDKVSEVQGPDYTATRADMRLGRGGGDAVLRRRRSRRRNESSPLALCVAGRALRAVGGRVLHRSRHRLEDSAVAADRSAGAAVRAAAAARRRAGVLVGRFARPC